MEFQFSRVDIQKTAEHWPTDIPFKPALLASQPTYSPYDWWIVDSPIVCGTKPEWAFAKTDQYVRIPLFQYTLPKDSDLALANLLALGVSCAGYLPGSLQKVHVVTGIPVDLVTEPDINTVICLQYWFGLALAVNKGV